MGQDIKNIIKRIVKEQISKPIKIDRRIIMQSKQGDSYKDVFND